MQIRFCFKSIFENSLFLSCLNHYFRVVFLYVGLIQWALGLSRTKGESPKDSNNATARENPDRGCREQQESKHPTVKIMFLSLLNRK